MKVLAICLLTTFVAVFPAVAPAASPKPKPKPKDYTVTALPDGRIEITVSGKAGLPSGSQVVVVNLREKLEAAAAQECPGGYDLETDNATSLAQNPNGRGFTTRQKGVVTCR